MVDTGKGRLFKRQDGKYLIYLPVDFAEDSQFPFKKFERGPHGGGNSISLKVSFETGKNPKLIAEPWKQEENAQ